MFEIAVRSEITNHHVRKCFVSKANLLDVSIHNICLFFFSDSTEVVTSDRIVIDTSGLLVKQVELEDAGIYTCHAFNMAGSVVAMATVTVYSM